MISGRKVIRLLIMILRIYKLGKHLEMKPLILQLIKGSYVPGAGFESRFVPHRDKPAHQMFKVCPSVENQLAG
jgi:hypothetical protein